jgi:hypothetical protein
MTIDTGDFSQSHFCRFHPPCCERGRGFANEKGFVQFALSPFINSIATSTNWFDHTGTRRVADHEASAMAEAIEDGVELYFT